MAIKTAQRAIIPSFRALDMLREVHELRACGHDLRSLGAGQPSVGAPHAALDYACEMIKRDPVQGYTEARGLRSLRENIAAHYISTYDVRLDPDNICITVGSSGGFIMALIAAFDVGDTVLLTTPTYPAYRNFLKTLGINVLEIEAPAADNYQPSVSLLDSIKEPFDGMIICSPSNPTGTMIAQDELEKICAWCERKNVRLISDEAYHGITYETPAMTARKYSKSAIILNTFSKYYAMTGWRLGWIDAPEDLSPAIKNLAENLFVSAPTIAQYVACKVLELKNELDQYVQTYRKNRDILLGCLKESGFNDISNAQGAFYVYADIHHISNDSEEFCRRLMAEAGVVATPGLDFDLTRGSSAIRLCYAGSQEDVEEACLRLKKWRR